MRISFLPSLSFPCLALLCLALPCLALLFHPNRDEISRIAVKRDEESYLMAVCEPQPGYGSGMVKKKKKVVAADWIESFDFFFFFVLYSENDIGTALM